jgi:NADPH-dependent curcumin reductase CurA
MGASIGRQHATPADGPTSLECHRWELVSRPSGLISLDNFALRKEVVDCNLDPGEVVVGVDMLSVDAFLRTMLDEGAFHGSIKLGDTVPALGYGRIIASANPKRPRGMRVFGMLGAQSVARMGSDKAQELFPMLSLPYVKASHSLGLLSITVGLTAWMGIHAVTRAPSRGDVVVVTGAAGATGSVAAQLAKLTGARVIGVAGGRRKADYLQQTLGLDGAVDYKDGEASVSDQLGRLCPDGVNFLFDTVGGEMLDDVLRILRKGARVVVCGASSQYNGNLNHGKVRGPSEYLKLAEREASMVGFTVLAHLRRVPFAMVHILWLMFRKKIFLTEQIEPGIESFGGAMVKMFTGGHIGKLLVDVNGGDSWRREAAPLKNTE